MKLPIEEVNVELTSGNVLTMDTMMEPLGTFKVTNCSIHKINSEQVHLAIHLQRISSSFWMSFLIPYIFIVLAAEITLFIDESHFKATFTVAITTNVVMYTLYRSIQEKLPEQSGAKLIDIWLLHGLLIPMIVFIILATNELINSSEKSKETTDKERNVVTPQTDTNSKCRQAIKVVPDTNLVDDGKEISNPGELGKDKTLAKKKSTLFMTVCRVVVPSISVSFMAFFFLVWYFGY